MRLRVTFSKGGPLTYTSHLDLARAWERTLRRGGVPLLYSGGFTPHPRLQLAAALPLGHTGAAEMLDVWLEKEMSVQPFLEAVMSVLPEGLAIGRVRQVPLKEPALATQVVAAEYRVALDWAEPPDRVEARIERVLAAEELPHERRGEQVDLRPLIEQLWVMGHAGPGQVLRPAGAVPQPEKHSAEAASGLLLGMQLAARQGATARPEAVLEALGLVGMHATYHRQRLILAGLAA